MRWVGRALCVLFWMLLVWLVPSSASWAADEPGGPSASASPSPTSSGTPSPDTTGPDGCPIGFHRYGEGCVVNVEPSPTPTATETVTPKPVVVTVTETATPEPTPPKSAPGVDSGVSVDPATGAVRMGEKSATALAVAAWLLSVVLGLWTAWLVLP